MIRAAHTTSEEEARKWEEELMEEFPGYTIQSDPLSLSVSCHIGKGSVAVTVIQLVGEYDG